MLSRSFRLLACPTTIHKRFAVSLSYSTQHRWQLRRANHSSSSIVNSISKRQQHTQAAPEAPPQSPYPQDAWTHFTDSFNVLSTRFPRTAALCFGAMRGGVFLAMFDVLHHIPATANLVGPELAIGYLVSASTRRIQTPFNLGLAPLITKVFPRISQFHCSFLTMVVVPKDIPQGRLSRFVTWINGPLDDYGMAYFVAGRFNSLLTVFAVAGALKYGFDLQSWLSGWGVNTDVQSEVTLMTASFLLNNFAVPLHFYGGYVMLKRMAEAVDANVARDVKEFQRQQFSRSHTRAEKDPRTKEQVREEAETRALGRMEFPLFLVLAYIAYRLFSLQADMVKSTAEGVAPEEGFMAKIRSYLPGASSTKASPASSSSAAATGEREGGAEGGVPRERELAPLAVPPADTMAIPLTVEQGSK